MKNASNRLATAEAALEAAIGQLNELAGQRDTALLKDDDQAASALLVEIEQQRRIVVGHQDKIRLLKAEAEREANERRVREKAALIGRIEKKTTERNNVAAELQDLIPQANRLMRRILTLNKEIDAAWPWPGGDRHSIMVLRETITNAIAHELYRVTAIPVRGGGQDEPDAGLRFPGARPPTMAIMGLPSAIPPLVDVLRNAGEHASNIMRGKVSAPAPAAAVVTNGGASIPDRPQTPAEAKLVLLLEAQSRLASLPAPTPNDDAEYAETVQQIALAQTALEQERANAR
jgi:hypothetical protein